MHGIFLDLDGTLIDPKPGLTAAIQHALREMGENDIPTSDELTWCIGPPLWGSFQVLLGEGADLDQAVAHYREYYAEEGMYDAEPYDDVGEMIEALRDTGAGIWIATSKPHVYAQRIIDSFGISNYVDGLFGSELDGVNAEKPELLAHALAETGVDAHRAIMIGDRRFDVEGARANAMHCIGVTWGYAEPEELRMADPDGLASDPDEVPELARDLLDLEG